MAEPCGIRNASSQVAVYSQSIPSPLIKLGPIPLIRYSTSPPHIYTSFLLHRSLVRALFRELAMTFAEVFSLPNSTIVDVAAVVCDVGPVDHYANFPNSVREVALMDSNYQVAFMRAFDQVTDFYQSQLITSETRRGIVVATALEVDKALNCLSTTAATKMLLLNNHDFQRYALLEEVRNSLFKEPVLHDAIKIGVTFRKQELLQMAEQNNASREPKVVIVEDDEVVIQPVPKNKGTANKAFTIPPGVKIIDIPSTP
uniref:Uncharacterized protein n=1 Tax=Oryza punctata TaxID=4537 RepID=A0A0E0LYP7_ORYPU